MTATLREIMAAEKIRREIRGILGNELATDVLYAILTDLGLGAENYRNLSRKLDRHADELERQ